ncbi:MAG: MFS transporter [Bacteroides sp.]|nr:MFS transporter [Bacillota bacterium]MCM1393952.1 MFS transporter [[Eubacterium] siraeum]MCM1455140.1 MFS transporter [Bacteroides sp.]
MSTTSLSNDAVKSTRLGPKIWFCAIFFGLIGQIAWIVENMYFATFAQDIYANSGRHDLGYVVTTLMVIFSAITATVTTIFAGGLCDKVGKRKPFISYGYIAWGITIMLFAAIPMSAKGAMVAGVAVMLIIFDCIMTLAGSTSNDAAFNAWVIDHTDTTNRGKVNAILSIMPVIAVVLVFIGLGPLYDKEKASNWLFFIVLGAIPLVAGVIAIFLLKDKPNLVKNANPNYLKETFYGFRPNVAKKNKMLYVTLTASCIVGIAQQTFFSYLINFVVETLGFGSSFVIPLAVIIVASAVFTGVCGVFYDKLGRKHFYIPLLAVMILSTLSLYLLKFTPKGSAGMQAILYIGGILMMGAILSLGGALGATFQDYIPRGYEGRFQGVRMCFSVLIPMIVGPIISLGIGMDAMGMNADGFTPPYEIFLAASIIALFAIIPIIFVIKDSTRLRQSLIAERNFVGDAAENLDQAANFVDNAAENLDQAANFVDNAAENPDQTDNFVDNAAENPDQTDSFVDDATADHVSTDSFADDAINDPVPTNSPTDDTASNPTPVNDVESQADEINSVEE